MSGSADVSWAAGAVEVTATLFGSRVFSPVQLIDVSDERVALRNAEGSADTWGTELQARFRRGPWLAMADARLHVGAGGRSRHGRPPSGAADARARGLLQCDVGGR